MPPTTRLPDLQKQIKALRAENRRMKKSVAAKARIYREMGRYDLSDCTLAAIMDAPFEHPSTYGIAPPSMSDMWSGPMD